MRPIVTEGEVVDYSLMAYGCLARQSPKQAKKQANVMPGGREPRICSSMRCELVGSVVFLTFKQATGMS